jgi:hypothetical protein
MSAREQIAAHAATLTEPTSIRAIAGAIGVDTADKVQLSAVARELRKLGWIRGSQIPGGKGSSLWWPPQPAEGAS